MAHCSSELHLCLIIFYISSYDIFSGGMDWSSSLNTILSFNKKEESWQPAGEMTVSRYLHAVEQIEDVSRYCPWWQKQHHLSHISFFYVSFMSICFQIIHTFETFIWFLYLVTLRFLSCTAHVRILKKVSGFLPSTPLICNTYPIICSSDLANCIPSCVI